MAPVPDKILTSFFLDWSENNLYHWIERKIFMVYSKRINWKLDSFDFWIQIQIETSTKMYTPFFIGLN